MGIAAFGARIRQEREARGLTQTDVAKAAGVHPSYVSRLEAGDPSYKSIGRDIQRAIAHVLGVPFAELEALLYDEPRPRTLTPIVEHSREVPLVADVSAGAGSYVDGYEYVALSDARGKSLAAARVTGACMEPELHPGDVVIFDRAQRTPRDGQTVVAVLREPDGDKGVVKRFYKDDGTIRLVPLVGEPLVLPAAEVRIEGVVVEVRRKYAI